MTSAAASIDSIADAAGREELDQAAAVAMLAHAAEQRGGAAGRSADGAYFTDADVADHLVRRALCALLLEAGGMADGGVDELLASGGDLYAAVRRVAAVPGSRAAMVERLGTLRVLDPTCGAGAFLAAAWGELVRVGELLDADVVDLSQLVGVDIDPDAVAACRATLVILAGPGRGAPDIRCADAQAVGSLPAADVVVGNPPYVRASAPAACDDLTTRGVQNRSAWIVERALAAARPGARAAFVLPISTACTDAFQAARDVWDARCDRVFTSHFDTIPASLFRGVVQRISNFEGRVRRDDTSAARWWTSRYHRWTRQERAGLLDRVRHVPLPIPRVGGSIAKVGTRLEADLLDLLFQHPPAGRWFVRPAGEASPNRFHYKRRWSYFLLFTDFMPGIWEEDGTPREPTEFKVVDVEPAVDARVLLASYSSTLFWWFFSVYTDNRNVNRRDLAAFPMPDLAATQVRQLSRLGAELMDALRDCAEVRTCTYRSIGTIRNTYFRQGATRPVLDRIDAALADAYGMTDAQLQFVVDYERRFRADRTAD